MTMLVQNVKGGAKRPGPGRPREADSYYSALRRKEHALARLRELEVAEKERQLLPADAVAREWTAVLRSVRANILAATSRIRQRCPDLSTGQLEAIDQELRSALAALADGE